MTELSRLPRKDLERLSSYLDGELSSRARAQLEQRMERDPQLASALEQLKMTASLLRALPQVSVPKNFTLTPQMVKVKQPTPTFPLLRFSTALATFLFLVVVGIDVLGGGVGFLSSGAPLAREMAAEQAITEEVTADRMLEPESIEEPAELPAEAMEEAPAEPEAEAPLAMAAPTPTPTGTLEAEPAVGDQEGEYGEEVPAAGEGAPDQEGTPEGEDLGDARATERAATVVEGEEVPSSTEFPTLRLLEVFFGGLALILGALLFLRRPS